MTYFQQVHEQSMSQSQTAGQRSSEWIFMKFYLPRQGPSLHLSIRWHGSPTILVDVLAYQQYKEPILRFSGLEMLIKISWLTTLTDDKIANQQRVWGVATKSLKNGVTPLTAGVILEHWL